MAATDIMQTVDFTKQSYSQSNCSCIDQIHEPKSIIIPSNNILKQEEIVQKPHFSFNESESIQQVRIRSLSHWPYITPSRESMASAGWFACNVADRVICIYCNTICHQWTMEDNPAEVHARLAPQCLFVRSISQIKSSPKIINETFNEKFQPAHPKMAEIFRREETFSKTTWPENAPTVADLVRAGFFFTGVANTVTCFFCNNSLNNWGPKDNPMIEHARWFPQCIYAKHLCGDELYRKIQMLKKNQILSNENQISSNELGRWVSARLDLPVVERLRSQYKLPIIKRCIEDQLRIKNDDFTSDSDLTMACLILQKQIDCINGCKDKIIIPSKNQQSEIPSQSSKVSLGECLICLTEEKQLACMPCGHLCACVPCGYALSSCPVCRQKIQSFIRINS